MSEIPIVFIDQITRQQGEIDRLKAELANANRGAERNANINRKLVDKNIDLERQLDASRALLAEARAENERLSAIVGEIANSGVGMNGNTPCTACEYNVNLCQKGLDW